MNKIRQWTTSSDVRAILILCALWLLFFWRLFTPIDADRVNIVDGDFSGQFAAFGAYQYERFSQGEVPLWNPYNNAGLPFIADTQAAVFYPPRLVTIGISNLAGGWSYNALQMEMTFHVLMLTLFMYAFIRRLTIEKPFSEFGAFASAIIAGYSGFTTGYPPLQLALLEASIWLPLALIGILEATRHKHLNWRWLLFAGFALGVSWMAGHPQTSWFLTYFIVAYFAYRVYVQHYGWLHFVLGTLLFGLITVGVVAVQLLPSLEYTAQTMRTGISFDEKANGFPIQDVIQFIYPTVVSIYSPLFVGITGLFLAIMAVVGKSRDYIFWSASAIIALALSFGANSAVFHMLYNLLPGLSLFRGQERAAYLVMSNLSILAGLGTVYLLSQRTTLNLFKPIRVGLSALLALSIFISSIVFVAWLNDSETFNYVVSPVFFSTVIISILLFILYQFFNSPQSYWHWGLIILLVFELFTVTIDSEFNYEHRQAWQPTPLQVPSFIEQIQQDSNLYRVDGNFFGLFGNYGTLFGVQDVRGISPLFLDGPHAIIQRELPDEVTWELFAVKYVLTAVETLPTLSEVISVNPYRDETVYVHELDNPRPFALLMYDYEVLDSDQFARALLANPDFNERETIILANDPTIELTEDTSDNNIVEMVEFKPEQFTLSINTSDNAILSLALVDYTGWHAQIDGESIETIRAYGALTAIPISEGQHIITFTYDPITYKIGAIISLFTWSLLIILSGVFVIQSRKKSHSNG